MNQEYKDSIVSADYLREHQNCIFVFGDNTLRRGKGGAAALRDEPNSYGFITKRYPNNLDSSFYRPEEYGRIFLDELAKLKAEIQRQPQMTFLISKLGAGLANRYRIFETVIEPGLRELTEFKNVRFLFQLSPEHVRRPRRL